MSEGPVTKQLWIGLVEVRPLGEKNEILGTAKGAFVNIVTWASNKQDFKQNVATLVDHIGGLFISEIVNPEPVEYRRMRIKGRFEEDIEDIIARAKVNPDAIIHGTFHTYTKDNA